MIPCLKSRALAVTLAFSTSITAASAEMTPLFDGRSLDGWEVRSGSGTYKVEAGVIVGTTTEGSLNTFLCTKRTYGDFVLEFEVQCDPRLNSGVQFRSEAYGKDVEIEIAGKKTKHAAGRVFGYQVEIAANGNAGRVYDEARRATWVDTGKAPGDETPAESARATAAARTAYQVDGWNRFRVIAQGDHIQTFINGIKITDFRDRLTAQGFIGLQVHRIKPGEGPFSVKWRNLRIRELRAGEVP